MTENSRALRTENFSWPSSGRIARAGAHAGAAQQYFLHIVYFSAASGGNAVASGAQASSLRIRTYFYWTASIALTFTVLAVGKDLLLPLVIALILWYLVNALAQGFGRIPFGAWRLPVPVRFVLSGITILSVLFGLSAMVTGNIGDLIEVMPVYQRNLEQFIVELFDRIPIPEPPTFRQVLEGLNITAGLSRIAVATTGTIGNIGIVLVYMVFLFLEQKSFDEKLRALVAKNERRAELATLIRHIESDIRLYIGIKMLTSSGTGVLSYVIMKLAGLDFAEFWAILIFVLNFIPTVGSIIATIFPTVLALVQFQSFAAFLGIGLGIGSLQFFIGNILEPRLMGSRLNLSPLVIVLSLALFAAMWGFVGMILSVPIMSIFLIVFSHFPRTRPVAILLSRRGRLDAIRSLGGDAAPAAGVAGDSELS
ncbi:MAG: AI-2E family transporter [Chitinivibrionales bacterium]|nr:AI-2E family transporter [Chitinivibrionales bacterium]MBD3397088.1 AI-2E family transporter [Chitinivibrionales bacterium]